MAHSGLLATRLRERDADLDGTEGILARIVETADETSELPDKTALTFQCGLEFHRQPETRPRPWWESGSPPNCISIAWD